MLISNYEFLEEENLNKCQKMLEHCQKILKNYNLFSNFLKIWKTQRRLQ